MRRLGLSCAVATVFAVAAFLSGCAVAQSPPPPLRPFGEIESVERGQVVSVTDTTIDLRTGRGRGLRTRTPLIPLGGIAAVGVPITVGGEGKRDVPGEEILVKLSSGKMITVTQELSSPPFAPGEKVKVLHEKASEVTGNSRIKVERED